MAKAKLPLQPLYIDKHKVVRFRENKVLEALREAAAQRGFTLNDLAVMDLPREDWQQFAQLIGYSLSGYSELSYVTDKAYERAAKAAPKIPRRRASRKASD